MGIFDNHDASALPADAGEPDYQTVTLTDPYACGLYAEKEGQMHVFYDMRSLLMQMTPSVMVQAMLANAKGDRETALMAEGARGILMSIKESMEAMLNEHAIYHAAEAVAAADTITTADFGFTGEDGDLS